MSQKDSMVLMGLILTPFSMMIMYISLKDNCIERCELWVLTYIALVIGTIMSAEYVIRIRKSRGDWYQKSTEEHSKKPKLTWTAATIRVVLTSLILSLPVFLQISFTMLISAFLSGVGILSIYKALTNQLAPVKE